MVEYVTVAQVDALLGPGWAGSGDPDRAVMLANVWMTAKGLPALEPQPDEWAQAAAEVARDAAGGLLYAGRSRELLETEVKAKGVESRKRWAEGSKAIPPGEQLANAILAPWIGSGSQFALVRG